MINREELFQGLNEEQKEAVLYTDGDSLILAGAGAGKTRVVTTKIAYLLTLGVAPFNILALTFTNKAAREMRERIANLVSPDLARYISMGTFHSVFASLLRSQADQIGYTRNFTIYDTTDSKALVKIILKEFQLDDKVYQPNFIHSMISRIKNDGLTPRDLILDTERYQYFVSHHIPKFDTIYQEYCSRCLRANAMDFDDLLLNMYLLLKNHPEVRTEYHQLFRHIFVDEYQDTNRIQHKIVQLLKAPNASLTVVGDDAQSIYSFRGAMIENIVNFNSSFKEAKLFKLTKNYRSTRNIVELANGLIEKNEYRIPKTVEAVAGEGELLLLFSAFTAPMEAQSVVAQIVKLIGEGKPLEEIAILYRTNAQSRLLEEFLSMYQIPYRIYGGLSFYDRKEVKDLIAYLRLIINPYDDEAFRRIYNTPTRGIGTTTFDAIATVAQARKLPLLTVAKSPSLLQGVLRSSGTTKVSAFVDLIENLSEAIGTLDPIDFLNHLIKASGIAAMYSDGSVDSVGRMDNINEFISAFTDHVNRRQDEKAEEATIESFINEMSLATDKEQTDDGTPRISLMTMHASKGLEFSYVFCVGLEESLIPSERAVGTNDIEEERRLLYVAITRAKQACTLSFAKERTIHGLTRPCMPSRFLYDLDPQYIQDNSGLFKETKKEAFSNIYKSKKSDKTDDTRPRVTKIIRKKGLHYPMTETTPTAPTMDFSVGDEVYHDRFGTGIVSALSDSVSGLKVTVDFNDYGTKQLIAKFAKLVKR